MHVQPESINALMAARRALGAVSGLASVLVITENRGNLDVSPAATVIGRKVAPPRCAV